MAYIRRSSARGRLAKRIARQKYRQYRRMPKRKLAKKYANTVGQIVYKSRNTRPSRGRFASRFRRNYKRY